MFFIPQMINPMVDDVQIIKDATVSEVNKMLILFVVCGDLRGFDSDMSYSLNLNEDYEYTYREVTQKPISPAYKEILDKLKNCSIKNSAITVKHENEESEQESSTKNDL